MSVLVPQNIWTAHTCPQPTARPPPRVSCPQAAQLSALGACLEAGPAGILGDALVGDLVGLAQKALADGAAARDKLRTQKRACDDEDDAEEWDAEMEAEEEAMCQALDLTTVLLKTEPAFLPHWQTTFYPQYTALLGKGLFETRLSLCAAASFLEHHAAGAAAPHVAAIAEVPRVPPSRASGGGSPAPPHPPAPRWR